MSEEGRGPGITSLPDLAGSRSSLSVRELLATMAASERRLILETLRYEMSRGIASIINHPIRDRLTCARGGRLR